MWPVAEKTRSDAGLARALATIGLSSFDGRFDYGSPAGWKKPVLKRRLVGWQNQIVAAAIAGRFIIEPGS
jgi:hypothetical protein